MVREFKFTSIALLLSKITPICCMIAFLTQSIYAINVIYLDTPYETHELNSDFTGVVVVTADNCMLKMKGYKISSPTSKVYVGIYLYNVNNTYIFGGTGLGQGGTGTIDNFNTAIHVVGGTNNQISDIDIINSNWGARVDYSNSCIFQTVFVDNPTYDGFVQISANNVSLYTAGCNDAGRFGFFADHGTNLYYYDCWAQGAINYDGIRIYNHSQPAVIAFQSSSNQQNGLSLIGNTSGGSFQSCHGFNDNFNNGIEVSSTSKGHLFHDCEGSYNSNWDVIDPNYREGDAGTPSHPDYNTYRHCDFPNIKDW